MPRLVAHALSQDEFTELKREKSRDLNARPKLGKVEAPPQGLDKASAGGRFAATRETCARSAAVQFFFLCMRMR